MITTDSIANRIARTITSKYNQNATMIFTGPVGTGKSYAALRLAVEVAKLIAKIKGGDPSDYFNLNKNMSVIDIMKFFTVLDNAQKYNIVILDDAGVSINARKFMDPINITINNITQTYRTLNLFTVLTVPEMYFVDRVSRSLVDFYVEMEGMITPNLSRGRLFEIQRKSRLGTAGKLFYVYPRAMQEKSILITFTKPPDDICKVYDKLRAEGALEYKTKCIAELSSVGSKKEIKESTPKKKDKFDEVEILRRYGDTIGDACAKVGISVPWYNRLRQKRDALSTTI